MKDVVYTAAGKHGTSGAAVLLNFKVIGVLYACSLTDQILFAVSSNTVGIAMRSWLQLPPEVSCCLILCNGVLDINCFHLPLSLIFYLNICRMCLLLSR